MNGMRILRNRRFKRWVAGGMAVAWLFTLLACALDTDAAEAPAKAQSLSAFHTSAGHQTGGDTHDDPCCQWQVSSIVSFNAVKLPQVAVLMTILPAVLLLILTMPSVPISVAAAPDRYAVRRRFEFLVHSLQAQAPPR